MSIWQKRKKKYEESYVIKFARLFSYPITVVLSKTSITPNMASFFSFVLVILASVLFILNNPIYNFWAGIIVWFALVFDRVDGEIARVKNMVSKLGVWLDGAFDRVKSFVILASISINVFQNNSSILIVGLGLLASVSTTMWRLISIYTQTSFDLPLVAKKPYKPIGLDVGMEYFLIALAAIFNQLFYLILFFAIVVNIAWIKNIVFFYFKYRKKFSF